MRNGISVSRNFNIAEVNKRYGKVFGDVTKVANLIQSISNFPEIIERCGDHPYSRVDKVVAEFLDLSQESKKENGEVEFYYSKTPKMDLLKSLPPCTRETLEKFVSNNINDFKNSENTHLQNLAGVFSLYGIGVQKDWKEAVRCFDKSALDQVKIAKLTRNPKHLFEIGKCYDENVGNGKDLSHKGRGFGEFANSVDFVRKASNYFEASADLGYSQAQYRSGLENIKKDPEKALRFFTSAAGQGFVKAIHELGNCYANGIGLQKDVSRAIGFFESAADKQCADSQCEMGKRYFKEMALKKIMLNL